MLVAAPPPGSMEEEEEEELVVEVDGLVDWKRRVGGRRRGARDCLPVAVRRAGLGSLDASIVAVVLGMMFWGWVGVGEGIWGSDQKLVIGIVEQPFCARNEGWSGCEEKSVLAAGTR